MSSRGGIPLVRANDPRGLLFPWQQNTLSFDQITGNQNLSRKDTDYTGSGRKRLESMKEVHGLSETVSFQQESHRRSDLEERIQSKRKIRHQNVLLVKKNKLDAIESEIQGEVASACEALKSSLNETDEGIAEIFANWIMPKVLASAKYRDVQDIATSLEKIFKKREELVGEFEGLATAKERERVARVTAVLATTASELYSIAFMLPTDVNRIIEGEAVDINMAVLSNRRDCTLLCESLTKGKLLLKKQCLEKWSHTFDSWSAMQCHLQEEKFSEYIMGSDVVDPSIIQQLVDKLHRDQEAINNSRIELLSELGLMKPAGHNKIAVYEWKERYFKLERKLDEIHSTFLLEWQHFQEKIHRECEQKMEEVKEYLVSSSILESSECYEFLNKKCLPLIESHQCRVTEQLQQIQKSLGSVCSAQQNQFTSLFQYAQGAAHILDTHLANQDTALQNKAAHLSNARSEHDLQNQTMEANLDIVLDRLRQCACDEELNEYLKLALEMLQNIKEGYVIFHDQMNSLCLSYPSETQQELELYDNKLCEYVRVSRKPHPKKKAKGRHGKSSSAAKKSETPKMAKQSTLIQHMTTPLPTQSSSSSSHATSLSPLRHDTQLEAILKEVLSTNNGTSFYVFTRTDSHVAEYKNESGVFMTQDEDLESTHLTSYVTGSLTIEEVRFAEAKRSFCINFLDHLETYKIEVTKEAEDFLVGKIEELRTELELRLHLHKPRPLRVKEDIHDIRKAELVAHQERLVKHVKAVTVTIQQQKDAVQRTPDKLDELYKEMLAELSNFRKQLPKANNSISINNILTGAEDIYKKLMAVLNDTVADKRRAVYGALDGLTLANSDYLNSLKLFSEGGNYCHQETEVIVARLEKQVQRISKARQTISVELDSIEQTVAKCCPEIYSNSFSIDFQHHSLDVTLTETISSKLIHCQLFVRTEVLASNSQSEEITKSIHRLREGFFSNDDFSDLYQTLPSLLELFSSRVQYLYCKSLSHSGSRTGGKDGAEIPSNVAMATGPISAINLTKNILSYTTDRDEDELAGRHTKLVTSGHARQGKRKKHQQLMERRHVNYGLGGGEDGMRCFLPIVRSALKRVHKELYGLVEEYYKQKGNRPVTKTDQIADSFEQMMDILIDRIQGYRSQAEEYRNKCIDELHDQLDTLHQVLSSIIRYLYDQLSTRSRSGTRKKIDSLMESYYDEMKTLSEAKCCQDDRLRPCLGHPNKASELRELNGREEKRFQQALDTIKRNSQRMEEILMAESRQFVNVLTEATLLAVRALEGLLAPGELVPRRPKPLSQDQLLRSVAHQLESAPTETGEMSIQVGESWPGIQDLTLAFGSRDTEKKMQAGIKRTKVTPIHNKAILARDSTLQEYQEWCVSNLKEWKQTFQEEKDKEEKVHCTWSNSVSTIKKLYSA